MRETAPELIVTNFSRRFTGVSATAAQVARRLARRYDLVVCGKPLEGCEAPVGRLEALAASRRAPGRHGVVVWHVRRNSEMQLAILARDVLRLPVRIVFTSAAQRLHSPYPRLLIERMDAVIATTPEAARLVPHVRAVIPHGVDTEIFAPAADREALWARSGFPGRRGIASIGRIRPEKGVDTFVRAMIDVLPRFPDVTAVAFGLTKAADLPFRNQLKAEIASAGLSERLLFPGEVEPARLAALLPAFSLLVASPRYEGFGMTALEAMASGVPFVATDTGIFRTISDGGRAGEIVPVDDPARLAAAVAGWLAAPRRIEEGARAAREIAIGSYSADREADGVAEVYEAVRRESRR